MVSLRELSKNSGNEIVECLSSSHGIAGLTKSGKWLIFRNDGSYVEDFGPFEFVNTLSLRDNSYLKVNNKGKFALIYSYNPDALVWFNKIMKDPLDTVSCIFDIDWRSSFTITLNSELHFELNGKKFELMGYLGNNCLAIRTIAAEGNLVRPILMYDAVAKEIVPNLNPCFGEKFDEHGAILCSTSHMLGGKMVKTVSFMSNNSLSRDSGGFYDGKINHYLEAYPFDENNLARVKALDGKWHYVSRWTMGFLKGAENVTGFEKVYPFDKFGNAAIVAVKNKPTSPGALSRLVYKFVDFDGEFIDGSEYIELPKFVNGFYRVIKGYAKLKYSNLGKMRDQLAPVGNFVDEKGKILFSEDIIVPFDFGTGNYVMAYSISNHWWMIINREGKIKRLHEDIIVDEGFNSFGYAKVRFINKEYVNLIGYDGKLAFTFNNNYAVSCIMPVDYKIAGKQYAIAKYERNGAKYMIYDMGKNELVNVDVVGRGTILHMLFKKVGEIRNGYATVWVETTIGLPAKGYLNINDRRLYISNKLLKFVKFPPVYIY